MARNSEKAQSMLYRFREQQAIDMGLGTRQKGDRRPRMTSTCTNLREAERWRGDIMRDIGRKVSKIQDASLTDYQVRDLNDEINQLFREKRNWENQIINLGGANYKRSAGVMVDDDGREVPGTRGYKYFGRAKELPGVKELFTRSAAQATEESARNSSFQMFRHQGPGYYGDEDELEEGLLAEEEEASRQEWNEQAREAAELLGITDETSLPAYPVKLPSTSGESEKAPPATKGKKAAANGKSKRKAGVEEEEEAKKSKGDEVSEEGQSAPAVQDAVAQAAAAGYLGVLDADSIKFPTLPDKEEMAKVLLEVRKQALRDEYGV
ncbi:hypothetical protein B9479_000792 [Cryptococcus floricola]|uniref:Pre-mRNA-splicing factor ISY1 n=1 Tax=Cryptococcus floricola TaxID=2591691 RepID=A0A5D3B6L5_9TREE|nr:hypothetical protein B9479_000792 [Cryptococcus floricola]